MSICQLQSEIAYFHGRISRLLQVRATWLQVFFCFFPLSKIHWITCLLFCKKWLYASSCFWSVPNPSNHFLCCCEAVQKFQYYTDIVFLLVTILFAFPATSVSICSIETGCFFFDVVVCILSAAFFPFYALVISVYKLFPKCTKFFFQNLWPLVIY